METGQDPLITFYRMLPGAPKPRRARHDAGGTLPTAAYRYCEPSRLASAFGYYVFLPMSFQVEWDGGTGGLWSFDGGAAWYPLSEAAFPDSMAAFDQIAPAACKGFCPPFLTFTVDHAMMQVWTGWFARTAPGYSLLVRGPANLTRAVGYEIFEGIVETDNWFGPLFVNIRFTRSGVPIHFDNARPFLQVQPLDRRIYAESLQSKFVVDDASAIRPELWQAYERSLIDPVVRNPERGHYAKTVRRRRAAETGCPVTGSQRPVGGGTSGDAT
jgi:hypothetical protein